MSDRATTIMDKLDEENALAKKHNLDNYHSGGWLFSFGLLYKCRGVDVVDK